MKTPHTVLLTYDRLEQIEVDIPIESIKSFYALGGLEEQFIRWVPERFAMTAKYFGDNVQAQSAAIELCIRALYRTIPKSKVTNLEVWVDSKPVTQIAMQ